MKKMIQSVGFLLTILCGSGCAKVDERVFLNVQMENNWDEHEKNPAKYAGTGIEVFINGNFCSRLHFGSSIGPVDKFLKPGSNTIEIKGITAFPVEIVICSFAKDHAPIRTILDQKWPNIVTNNRYESTFSVQKSSLLPIFEKKNVMPDRASTERELTCLVSNLYENCSARNKDAFIRTSLEGYRIHSPSDYLDVMNTVESMFDSFSLMPFPEKLQFVHGSNLVVAFSCTNDNSFILFPPATEQSAAVSGIHFAYINKRWVAW